MTLKDILLHVDSSQSADARIAYTAQLAQIHDAHVTGLYMYPSWTLPAYVDAHLSAELLAKQQEKTESDVSVAQQNFENQMERHGLLTEWREMKGNSLDNLVLNSRYFDLSILGQFQGNVSEFMELDYAGKVALESGRPVLVVPSIGVSKLDIDRVLVAWSGSRESVRAVNDSLPILRRAAKVFVLSVNLPKEEHDSAIPGADISLHLSRHGVLTEAETIVGADISIGDVLLSRAADKSVDLIVMGAYGRSRFRELVLGGATRELLEHMTVPVLFSH